MFPRHWPEILLLFLLPAVLQRPIPAQERPPISPEKALEGRLISSLEVGGTRRVSAARIREILQSREGRPFSLVQVDRDVKRLWDYFHLQVEVSARPVGEDRVALRYDVLEFPGRGVFADSVILGNRELEEDEVRRIMRLNKGASIDLVTARAKRRPLLERYDRKGYIFARVRLEPSPDGRVLRFVIDEGPRVLVHSFTLEGNRTYPTDATLGMTPNVLGSAGVSSRPTSICAQSPNLLNPLNWLPIPWILIGRALDPIFFRSPYSPKTLAEDLRKIRIFYRSKGFREARAELGKVSFSPDFTLVDIEVIIHEGPRYKVTSVDLESLLPVGREKPLVDKEPLLEQLGLKPGMFYDLDRIERDHKLIKDYYGRRGFPSFSGRDRGLKRSETFEVLDPREVLLPDRQGVALTYRVREGFPKRLRKISISGNRNTRERVIRREIGLHPGDPVDMVELQRSLYRLDGLQYFNDSRGVSSVKSRFRSVEGSPEEVDLEIDLREGRTGNIFLTAGVSTNLGFIGRFSIRRRNFDILRLPEGGSPTGWISQILEGRAFYGGGQSLTLDVSPGSKLSFFNISFNEPDLLGRHEQPIGLTLDLFKRLRYYREYLQDSLGGGFRLGRRFGRRTRLSLGLTAETVEVRDIEDDAPQTVWDSEGSAEIRTLDLLFRHDATDHPIQPSSGFEVSLRPEVAGGFLGGSERFWGVHWEGKGYLSLFRDGMDRPHVLALNLGFDWRDPIGSDEKLHIAKRLFLGGRGTLRGFRFRGAGPTQFGNPTGGEARWNATLEYLVPVFSIQPERGGRQIDMVRLVFFADAGALGTTISTADFEEIRLALGAGIRIKIPGLSNIPLALDFGFPVRRQETDEREVFSFRLGLF